ncbi:MAG TPA: KH domain-containing protein [Chthonomonadales bacterium]|nr:KH domain-containing protein [Chthonomonadales bacterium]
MSSMQAFIRYLVQAVVDSPDDVRVDEEPGEVATTYKVHVAPSDLGKAIGKQGRIANAMRVLAKASAMKEKRKVYLEVVGAPVQYSRD